VRLTGRRRPATTVERSAQLFRTTGQGDASRPDETNHSKTGALSELPKPVRKELLQANSRVPLGILPLATYRSTIVTFCRVAVNPQLRQKHHQIRQVSSGLFATRISARLAAIQPDREASHPSRGPTRMQHSERVAVSCLLRCARSFSIWSGPRLESSPAIVVALHSSLARSRAFVIWSSRPTAKLSGETSTSGSTPFPSRL